MWKRERETRSLHGRALRLCRAMYAHGVNADTDCIWLSYIGHDRRCVETWVVADRKWQSGRRGTLAMIYFLFISGGLRACRGCGGDRAGVLGDAACPGDIVVCSRYKILIPLL